jgi:hypothetical protein
LHEMFSSMHSWPPFVFVVPRELENPTSAQNLNYPQMNDFRRITILPVIFTGFGPEIPCLLDAKNCQKVKNYYYVLILRPYKLG